MLKLFFTNLSNLWRSRKAVRKWAEHILITEWNFLILQDDEGKFFPVLLGELETMTGTIEIYIADATVSSVSVIMPNQENVGLGFYPPGSWPWRKLREIKKRDRLFAEIASARMFTGDYSAAPMYDMDLPDLPFMNFDGDDILN